MQSNQSVAEGPTTDASTDGITYIMWRSGDDGRLRITPVAGRYEYPVRTFTRLQKLVDDGRIPDINTEAVVPRTPGSKFRGALDRDQIKLLAKARSRSATVIDDSAVGGEPCSDGEPMTLLLGEHPDQKLPAAYLVVGDELRARARLDRALDAFDHGRHQALVVSAFTRIDAADVSVFYPEIAIDHADLRSMAKRQASKSAGAVLHAAEVDRLAFASQKQRILERITEHCDTDEAIETLDEATHEIADGFAATINNEGFDSQASFLLEAGVDADEIFEETADEQVRQVTSAEASEANNGGLDAQVDYLLRHGDDGPSIVERITGEEAKPSPAAN